MHSERILGYEILNRNTHCEMSSNFPFPFNNTSTNTNIPTDKPSAGQGYFS